MPIQSKEKNGVTHLSILDEMTIYTALEQKNELAHHLKDHHELQIDLSEVSEVDSAGLQILLFLKQEASKRNITLSLVNHSQAIVEVLELLNLSAHFGDPIMISADWKTA